MFGTLLSLIPSFIGLFGSNKAHDKYSSDLSKISDQQTIPGGLNILADQANTGIQGKEGIEENIKSQLPTTLGETKDWLTSGQAVDYLAKGTGREAEQIRNLQYADAAKKEENKRLYAEKLIGSQDKLLQDKSQLGIASAYNTADKSATENQYMFNTGNSLAKLGDQDWSKLIAALSSDKSALDPSKVKPTTPTEAPFDAASENSDNALMRYIYSLTHK